MATAVFGRINVRGYGRRYEREAFPALVDALRRLGEQRWTYDSLSIDDEWAMAVPWDRGSHIGGLLVSVPTVGGGYRQLLDYLGRLFDPLREPLPPEVLALPFAIDTERQWVAITVVEPLPARSIADGLQRSLRGAIARDSRPRRWDIDDALFDVDLVCCRDTIRDWLEEHQHRVRMSLTLRYPNPWRDLTEDIRAMEELRAQEQTRTFRPPSGGELELNEELVRSIEEAVSRGYADVEFAATTPAGTARFASRDVPDSRELSPEFLTDVERDLDELAGHLARYRGRDLRLQ